MRTPNLPARIASLAVVALFLAPAMLPAQSSPHQPGANAYYQQLRTLLPTGNAIQVREFTLTRDAAVFTFHSGSFVLYGAVNGKITGAVFRGEGSLHLVPPTDQERHSLSLLTKEPQLDETFDTAVLRFTDGAAAEIQKASVGSQPGDPAFDQAARHFANDTRDQLHWNVEARLLEDVLSPAPGGFFLAAIDGKKYASRMIFIMDPHGAPGVSPEEEELMTWNGNRNGIWAAFHYQNEYQHGIPDSNEENNTYNIEHQDLDTTLEKNGALRATATINLRANSDGVVVVPLLLYPTLRVSSVQTADGQQLDFIQESKDKDPDFAVVLPAPLKKAQAYQLKIAYAGKDVVKDEGGGNYYLEGDARDSWYPNVREGGLGGYATYHMIFRVPKDLDLVATGEQVREYKQNGDKVTEWKSEIPIAVAGFNMGRFKVQQIKMKNEFVLSAYANSSPPDQVAALENTPDMALGTMQTTGMLKTEIAQAEVALEIYSHVFGDLQFQNLALTQQTPCNYGQSWPMLVYLPICAFWDTTIRHELGVDSDRMYWHVVVPHEVAHQWWGQTVSFRSYRDQWMSEGFADFSASLFLQSVNKDSKDFRDFWDGQRKLITDKNQWGFRPIDVGPVTMGYRLVNSRSGGDVYRDLVYPKGAYIMHMLRMMNWSPRDGDLWLQQTMHDFVETYRNRPATTEDLKAMLEKHMTPSMNLDGNGDMDWFFNEYVYGTALPHYSFSAELAQDSDGQSVHLTLAQSNVTAAFKMRVPVYAELQDGRVFRLLSIPMFGETTFDRTLKLPRFPTPVKRLMINYYGDVLCIQD